MLAKDIATQPEQFSVHNFRVKNFFALLKSSDGSHFAQANKGDCCARDFFRYIVAVNRLTKQEQLVLCIVLGLLLTGLVVKFYRESHPSAPPVQQAKP